MKKLLAFAVVILAQSAHATVFDFAGLADKKTTIDGYVASLSGEKGWSSFSWTVDGLTVEATAWYTTTVGSGRNKHDVVNNAFAYMDHDKAGLGVCKAIYTSGKDVGECKVASDDNIQKNEYLQLKFSQDVNLDVLKLKNGDHNPVFAAGSQFGLNVDGGSFVNYALGGTVTPTGLMGNTFVFKGLNTGTTKEFYINSLTATAKVVPVPEPETYALMGLGLLAVAVAKRRNKI